MTLNNTETINGVDISTLSEDEKVSMRLHGHEHSSEPLREMVSSMNGGNDFNKAHEDAMGKVGE